MAFKIKDGIKISSVDVFNNSGELLVNAPTASKLLTARTISLSGDASGSVSFDGSQNADIVVTITGLDTGGGGDPTFTSDLVGDVYASNGTSKILENGTNGTDAVFTGSLIGNASTASAWQTARTVTFATGDVTGNFTIDGSANVGDIALTLVNDSITIGTTTIALGTTQTSLAGLTELTVDDLNFNGNTISSTNDGITLTPASGSSVDVSGRKITSVATPTNATDAANKQYVDNVAQGINALPSADVATTANLTATYNHAAGTLTATANGAFPVTDGYTVLLNDNVLVKDQTNAYENGSYILTTVGDTGTPWVLTRAEFFNEESEIEGGFEFVTNGTLYINTGWVATIPSDFIFGSTDASADNGFTTKGDIVWVQFSGAGTYVAGLGLDLNGNEFSLSHLGIEDLVDPNADSIIFWDDSANKTDWLTIGTGLAITGTTINNTQLAFQNIAVSGQDTVVADTVNDTLTLVAGDNITITTNAGSDSITISSTNSFAGDTAFDDIVVNGITTTSPTVIDSFALATYRSAKYYVQVSQGSNFQISELMTIHDGTTTYDTEFAVLETLGELGTLTTAVNGANIELRITMGTTTSANVRIKRLLFEV
jgi:hypothetical protein